MSELHDYFKTQQEAMIDLITQMVEIESFSTSKAEVDVLVEFMESQFKAMGADSVTRFPRETVGDCLLAKWNSDAAGKPFLFMGHIDTVHPIGWIQDHPVRHDDEGRIYGPGIVDMKAGNAIAMTAIKGLQERGDLPDNPIWFLITTDEEIGSLQSRALIEDTAKDAGLVLVMEPGVSDGGAVKSWRKGTASYRLDVEGQASHAGVAPEEGINAIIEFAQHALEINKLNDLKYGTSVSITMI
ncbi:MAG: M20/M25/M40 family metallo-hydrolase, partial [Aggregatilineales bacterium]